MGKRPPLKFEFSFEGTPSRRCLTLGTMSKVLVLAALAACWTAAGAEPVAAFAFEEGAGAYAEDSACGLTAELTPSAKWAKGAFGGALATGAAGASARVGGLEEIASLAGDSRYDEIEGCQDDGTGGIRKTEVVGQGGARYATVDGDATDFDFSAGLKDGAPCVVDILKEYAR